jgi:ribonuclease HII
MKTAPPSLIEEDVLRSKGFNFIAGIDEAGRGSLAGPVVAASVILPQLIDYAALDGVRDSKELTPVKRELLHDLIMRTAIAIGIGVISSQIIDSINILNATRMAMHQAVQQLIYHPDFILIDGMTVPEICIPQKGIIKGDRLCLSIACASIIAKVTRDHIMVDLDEEYPNYGLACHKGYGTRDHLINLAQRGPSAIHRFTFAPVKEACILL